MPLLAEMSVIPLIMVIVVSVTLKNPIILSAELSTLIIGPKLPTITIFNVITWDAEISLPKLNKPHWA